MESRQQTCQGCLHLEERVDDLEKQINELKTILAKDIKLAATHRRIHESLTKIKKKILGTLNLTSDEQFEEIFSFDTKIDDDDAFKNYRFKNPNLVWSRDTYDAFFDERKAKRDKYYDIVVGLAHIEKQYLVPFEDLLIIVRLPEALHEYEVTGKEEAWIEKLNPLCNSE